MMHNAAVHPLSGLAPLSRGGHRHLQIGRLLDIDLISEPPTPPPPRCKYPKCGNLCGQRGRKRFIASWGPRMSHICPRSKVVILPTTAPFPLFGFPSLSSTLQGKSHLCIPFLGIVRPLVPNSHVHVSASDLYVFPGSVHIIPCSRISRPVLEVYESPKYI
jgi:hypothetical protein